LFSSGELLIEKPEKNVRSHTRHSCALFSPARVLQVYSAPRDCKMDRLMMDFAERDGKKWGVMESSKMVLLQVLR
jgi:hypothetical protein